MLKAKSEAMSWYFESGRDAMIKMYKDCACKDGLFIIEEILWKRLLKRLWGVLHLEVQIKEEAFKKSNGKSVQAWDDFQKVNEMHFETLKSIFINIYKDLNPLITDLKFENPLRALTAQHLLHLGDLSKYKTKYHPDEKPTSKPTQDESWSFYQRAKTVYPFEGRIYSSLA